MMLSYPDRQCQQRRGLQRTAARPVNGSEPAEIAVEVACGHALEAAYPILEPGVVSIDVLNVIDTGDDPDAGRQIDRAMRSADLFGGRRQGAAAVRAQNRVLRQNRLECGGDVGLVIRLKNEVGGATRAGAGNQHPPQVLWGP